LIEIRFRHFFYIANLLSLLRLILVIPIYMLLPRQDSASNLILLGLIGIAIASDWLDGFFARKLNQQTDLGRILDPLADKILIVLGLLGFVIFRGFPPALVILLAYRDLVILIGGIIITKKTGRLTESNIFGKGNTLIISLAGFIFLISPDWWGTSALFYLSYISIIISGCSYLLFAFRSLRINISVRTMMFILAALPVILVLYFMHDRLA
jgi:CDP-diacylglycerol--glycerol-3-phosphate 3-phosphatidyltransferase